MKDPRFRNTVTGIALTMVLVVIHISFARAQGPAKAVEKTANLRAEKMAGLRARVRADLAPQSSDRKEQTQYSQEELEQVRSALLELAGAVRDFSDLAPNQSNTDRLDEVTKRIADLSYQQLSLLRKGLNPSKLSERLAAARASIAEYKGSIQRQSAAQNPKKGRVFKIASEPFPSRDPFCSDGRFSAASLALVDEAYFLAEGVRDAAKDACLETLIVLGEGGNTSLVCLVTDAIYIVAHAVWEAAHFCNEEFTDATVDANYERLEHLHEDLASSVENDNSNKTMIVNNDNTNKTAIITEVDLKATALSTQISAGTTDILNKIESKGNDILNNDNTNRTQIINNDNTNTANIITNANANKTMIINNDNANFAATINELRALGCDVIRLLNTPDGQRSSSIASCAGKPGFPYSWNNKLNSAPVLMSSAKVPDARKLPDAMDGFSNQRGQDGVPILPIMGTVTMETHLLAGTLIPTYYLPANRGGLIEQVKLMVWNTIESQTELKIAQDETTKARAFAQEADQLLAARKYVEAYRQYCLAYRSLVPVN